MTRRTSHAIRGILQPMGEFGPKPWRMDGCGTVVHMQPRGIAPWSLGPSPSVSRVGGEEARSTTLEAEVRALRAVVASMPTRSDVRRMTAAVESLIGTTVRGGQLPIPTRKRTIPRMQAVPPEPGRGRAGRKISVQHPFALALATRGLFLCDWAASHGVSPQRVRSWYATDPDQRRRIPVELAQEIEREFGVPADDSTWPQGLK